MAKSKYILKSGPFSFVFWPEISTSLRDPLGCSDLSQIFFGSSLIATEWDKIVAEIIHKTFVFLRHPTAAGEITARSTVELCGVRVPTYRNRVVIFLL